ncbi:MAG: hypothetical protein KDC44_06365 [Phaeodactylibacter sp.]|nr:hypothetical protein [Phaeodactylibacter sp.]
MLGFFWMGCDAGDDPEVLYANNFVPIENLYKPTERRQVPETIEEKAFVEYDRKNYPEAARWLQKLESPDAGQRFYLAVALMASQQESAAKPLLEQLIQEDQPYKPLTEWYLALCFVRENQMGEAEALLDFIAQSPGHPYQGEAGKLLERVK